MLVGFMGFQFLAFFFLIQDQVAEKDLPWNTMEMENAGLQGEKMVEEDQGLWTVECLRGRLLAERAASKAAKQDAQLMERKLLELEKQLRLEIQSKNKAEKKLNYLMKKLESLEISPVRRFSSPVNCEDYCSSNISEEEKSIESSNEREMSKTTSSSMSEGVRSTNSEAEDIDTSSSRTPAETYSPGADLRQTPASIKGEKSKVEECVDNTQALTPTNLWPIPQGCEPPIDRLHVDDDLLALRRAKQHVQNSAEKGAIINSHSVLLSAGV